MRYSATKVKNLLNESINEIEAHPKSYSMNPNRDFTRKRKIPMKKAIESLLVIGGRGLRQEMLNFYRNTDPPSASAFVQQRQKLKPEAFEAIFHLFTQSAVVPRRSFHGLRLIAVDGSVLHVPTNEDEKNSLFPGTNGQKPYNLMHLNTLYDLDRKLYLDAIVQEAHQQSEHKAFVTMVDRYTCDIPTLFIADRGYESYNNMAHIQEKKQFFLIRIKDIGSNGIFSGLPFPEKDEFDQQFDMKLTRTRGKQVNGTENIKYLSAKTNLDFLPPNSDINAQPVLYTLHFRIVRFKLTDDTYETLVTNLPCDYIPSKALKKLYAMRWGIEVSFRSLKYSLGLNAFHSKKTHSLLQEIFAKLTMYNLTSLVMMSFEASILSRLRARPKPQKYQYKANFSIVVKICYRFLLSKMSSKTLLNSILKNLHPIRPSQSKPRCESRKYAFSFFYRIP